MRGKKCAIILAGGKGERFWPLSTSKCPKQFLSLLGGKTLIEEAVDRLEGVVEPGAICVVTNREFLDVARRAAPKLPPENIIGEPVGRDTAAAIALGTACCAKQDPASVCAVLTADHVIGDLPVFRNTLSDAFEVADEQDVLITLGITPVCAATGYGYIHRGGAHGTGTNGTVFDKAMRFVEKPDLPTAERYLAEGGYSWNSGMFIWSCASIRRAFERHSPALAGLIDRMRPLCGTPAFADALAREYEALGRISIDYAVMEKAGNVLVASAAFAWDDVGAWPALERHCPANEEGNVVIGEAASVDAEGNIVFSKDRLTALVGVRDLVVVQADGVTLVCHKDAAQQIKALVGKLGAHEVYRRLL